MVETTHLSDSAREDGWNPLRQQFDIRAFGVNAWTVNEAGAPLIGEHDESGSGHEELYVLVSGHATFTVDGEEVDAVPGTAVFVRNPESKRAATALVPGTTVLAVGGKAGEAYVPRAWETNSQIFPLFGRGEYAEARRGSKRRSTATKIARCCSTTSPAPRCGWGRRRRHWGTSPRR